MKNERYKLGNPTETRTIQSRTQIAAQNSELGSNDSTGYRNPKSLSTAAAYISPPQRIPKGSGEVLERDRGSKSPVSFQPPPRGANKIYTYDVVFSMGGSQYKQPQPSAVPLYAPARSNKIYNSDAVSPIGEANTNPISPAQFPYTPIPKRLLRVGVGILVRIVENVGKLVVEDVGDLVEFLVVLDGFENLLAVVVHAALEDHVFLALLVAVLVHGDQSLIDAALVLQSTQQREIQLVAVLVGQCIDFRILFFIFVVFVIDDAIVVHDGHPFVGGTRAAPVMFYLYCTRFRPICQEDFIICASFPGDRLTELVR